MKYLNPKIEEYGDMDNANKFVSASSLHYLCKQKT